MRGFSTSESITLAEKSMKTKVTVDAKGRPLPTTPYVTVSGQMIKVEDLTPHQLAVWQTMREVELMPNFWENKGHLSLAVS